MDSHGASCPNPHCTCVSCDCHQPCKCGLRAVAHNEDTRWDANDRVLRHTVTTTYQPDDDRPPSSGHDHRSSPGLSMAATDDVNAALQSQTANDAQVMVSYGAAQQGHGGHEGHTSIRNAEHRGHQIEIHTTYRVTVDGKELGGHFGVDQDGTTHYHGLPNYQQASAVELVKTVIDQFPDDFPGNEEA